MKSKGDPILDLQALCEERPRSEEELKVAFKELGWGMPFHSVLPVAKGTYVVEGEDGLFHSRNGKVEEVIRKTLSGS